MWPLRNYIMRHGIYFFANIPGAFLGFLRKGVGGINWSGSRFSEQSYRCTLYILLLYIIFYFFHDLIFFCWNHTLFMSILHSPSKKNCLIFTVTKFLFSLWFCVVYGEHFWVMSFIEKDSDSLNPQDTQKLRGSIFFSFLDT